MKIEELLEELKVRFNTEPKKYEKKDFNILIAILLQMLIELTINKHAIEEINSSSKNGASDDLLN